MSTARLHIRIAGRLTDHTADALGGCVEEAPNGGIYLAVDYVDQA